MACSDPLGDVLDLEKIKDKTKRETERKGMRIVQVEAVQTRKEGKRRAALVPLWSEDQMR
jgi:hypothetical protein